MCSPSTCRRSWHCTVVLLPLLVPNHGMNRETQRSVKQELEGVHPALLGIALRDHGTMTMRPSRAPKSVPTNPAKAQAFWIAKQLSQRLGEIRHLLWHRFFGIDAVGQASQPASLSTDMKTRSSSCSPNERLRVGDALISRITPTCK